MPADKTRASIVALSRLGFEPQKQARESFSMADLCSGGKIETFSMTSRPHLISTDPISTPSISDEGAAPSAAKRRRKVAMPRFYFHVRDESNFTSDDEGQQFPDLEAARRDALKAIEMLAADLPPDFAQRNIAFEITDERGHVVLTLPFRNADEPHTGRTAQIIQGPWG